MKLLSELIGLTAAKKPLEEMADASNFTSGWMKSARAKELVKAFKSGTETYDMKDGKSFKATKMVPGNKLEQGMIVFASHSSTNQGAQIYEILGFTDDDKAHGDGGVKFKSVKELFAAKKVTSLKALEDLQSKNPHGFCSYLVAKDLTDNDSGPWFYLYHGSWVIGSGAEKLSFYQVEEVKKTNEELEPTSEEDLINEAIQEIFELASYKLPAGGLKTPPAKLKISKVHTVKITPKDKGFEHLQDCVFGIRNEDPIIDFLIACLGVPEDGTAYKIRTGFMKYNKGSKMLLIAKFKKDLESPGLESEGK